MLSSSRVELLVILVLLVSALLKVATAKAISLGCMDRNSMLPFRGLLAVCVVVHHIPGTIVSLGAVAVGAFFFLPGYGMFQSCSNKRRIDGQQIYRWVVRLMLPFFGCVIIWVVSLKCLHYFGLGNGIEISQFPAKLMSGHSGDVLPNCWFVQSLLVLKLIFGFSFRVSRRLCVSLIILFAGTFAYYIFVRYYQVPWWWRWCSLWSFLVGILWAIFEDPIRRLVERFPVSWFVMLTLAYLAFRLGVEKISWYRKIPLLSDMSHILLGPIFASFCYVFPAPKYSLLRNFGTSSYEIYLLHGMVYGVSYIMTECVWLSVVIMMVSTPLLADIMHRVNRGLFNRFQCN